MPRFVLLSLLIAAGCGSDRPTYSRNPIAGDQVPLRVKMEDLHMMGGVPANWKLTPPPGDPVVGKKLFVDYGCHSCHKIQGEAFGGAGGGSEVGPDLTGMGAHHPAGYFAEAILNPNAILVDGAGYVGPDGKSIMPSYDSMTIAELADLVAYLRSLNTGEAAHKHDEHIAMGHMQPQPSLVPAPLPPPPAETAGAYVTMVYDVLPGKLEPFMTWFRRDGVGMLQKVNGFLSQDTYVDATREVSRLITTLRFKDHATLDHFMNVGDPTFGEKWDEFLGPHGHFVFVNPPVYRVAELSTP